MPRISQLNDASKAALKAAVGVESAFDLSLQNILPSGDFTGGQQGWVNSGSGFATSFSGAGLLATYAPAGAAAGYLRFYRQGGVPLVAGRQYAFVAEMTASADRLVRANFTPFILSTPGLTWPNTNVFEIGTQPATLRPVWRFTAPASMTTGNAYFDIRGPYRDAANQSISTFSISLEVKWFMLLDLGPAGSKWRDLSDSEVAEVAGRAGYYYPNRPATVRHAVEASRAVHARWADDADRSQRASEADRALTVRNAWEGKRFFTYGDSLVSQQTWQGMLFGALGATFTATGTPGGTVSSTTNGGYLRSTIANIPNNPAPDAGIIFHGANDAIAGYQAGGIPLGDPTDAPLTIAQQTGGATPASFCQAYNTMLYNLMERFGPDCRYFICTQQQYFNSYFGPAALNANAKVKADAIREIAKRWGYPLIDLWADTGINLWNRHRFLYTEDGDNLWVHHSPSGAKRIAEVIRGRLLEVQPWNYTAADYPHTAWPGLT